jgi:hypothetical protein
VDARQNDPAHEKFTTPARSATTAQASVDFAVHSDFRVGPDAVQVRCRRLFRETCTEEISVLKPLDRAV